MRNPKLREPFLGAAGLMPPRPGSLARVLHLAMLPRGLPPPRGLYTRYALHAHGRAGLRRHGPGLRRIPRGAAAVHRGALPRAAALASPGKAGKKAKKKGTRNFVHQVTTTSYTSQLQGLQDMKIKGPPLAPAQKNFEKSFPPDAATGAATMNAAHNRGTGGEGSMDGFEDNKGPEALFQGGKGSGQVAFSLPRPSTALTPNAKADLVRDGIEHVSAATLVDAVRLLENLGGFNVKVGPFVNTQDGRITLKEAQKGLQILESLLDNKNLANGSLTELKGKDNSWWALGKRPDPEKGETIREHYEKILNHYKDLLAAARLVVNNGKNIAGLDGASGTISVRDVIRLKEKGVVGPD